MKSPLAPEQIVALRYQLVERLDDFGAGEVWKARDVKFRARTVALKLLRPLDDVDADALPVELDAHLAAVRALRHRAVLPIVNHGVADRRPFVAYEFFAGASLGAKLDAARRARAPLALERVRAVFETVCGALSAAHECDPPVVHGALGAAQVLVGDDGAVRVIDFGLGPLAESAPVSDRSARAAPCLAPEQYAGQPPRPPSDVFALGLLLMELLAAPPDARESVPAAWRYVGRADVPDALWDVILGATRADPDDRHPSPEAFAQALAPTWDLPAPAASLCAVTTETDAPAETADAPHEGPPLLSATLVDPPRAAPAPVALTPVALAATEVLLPGMPPVTAAAATALWTNATAPSPDPAAPGGDTLRAKAPPALRAALAKTALLTDETSALTEAPGPLARTALFTPRRAAQMTSLSAVVSDLDRLAAERRELPPLPAPRVTPSAPSATGRVDRDGHGARRASTALWVGVGVALVVALLVVVFLQKGGPS